MNQTSQLQRKRDVVFQEIGLSYFENAGNFCDLLSQGRSLAKNAGNTQGFFLFKSGIPSSLPRSSKSVPTIAIDFGGTDTKAALLTPDRLVPLLKVSNETFGVTGLHAYCEKLFSIIASNPHVRGIANNVALACVWSNAAMIEKLQGSVTGITARATVQKDTYKKGEPFVVGLQDKEDIGRIMIDCAISHGLSLKAFIISNDTVFTFTSHEGVTHGAGIISTGANATLILDDEIVNPEMGGLWRLPPETLSKGDHFDSVSSIRIEEALAGIGIPERFASHVLFLATNHGDVFQHLGPLSDQLKEFYKGHARGFYKGTDITNILNDQSNFEPAVSDELKAIAEALVRRATKLGAAMIYTSLSQGSSSPQTFVLDSALARKMPGFLPGLQKELLVVEDHTGIKVNLVLSKPLETDTIEISVPLQGAVRAIQHFL